jgi:hypothetical protein
LNRKCSRDFSRDTLAQLQNGNENALTLAIGTPVGWLFLSISPVGPLGISHVSKWFRSEDLVGEWIESCISPNRLTVIVLVSKNNQRIIIFFKLEHDSQKGWPNDAQIK